MSSLNLVRVSVASAGLTTATTLYDSGDVLGTAPLAFDMDADSGLIISAVMLNATINMGAVDLFLFDRSITAAANNAANAFSDSDRLHMLGIIQFPFPTDDANGQTAALDSISLAWSANSAQTIYGVPVTRSTATVHFASATDLQFVLSGSKDV